VYCKSLWIATSLIAPETYRLLFASFALLVKTLKFTVCPPTGMICMLAQKVVDCE
jgi:hypothetical protein